MFIEEIFKQIKSDILKILSFLNSKSTFLKKKIIIEEFKKENNIDVKIIKPVKEKNLNYLKEIKNEIEQHDKCYITTTLSVTGTTLYPISSIIRSRSTNDLL